MPVDPSMFAPPADGAHREGVLFVGRLNQQKGVSDLLTAFALIDNPSATMLVVGDGPEELSLRAQASALGIGARVLWLGALKQPELVVRYQQAAVVAMPSREEGLGLVAVEAQLCGTPVVGYDSGGLTDVVQRDAGGTLVQPGNIAAFAAALSSFTANTDQARERARTLGAAARDAMLHTFSPAAAAERYKQLYAHAVGGLPPDADTKSDTTPP